MADAPQTPEVVSALDNAVAHLELLGYQIQPLELGWLIANHPYRHDFALAARVEGIRLYCSVPIGKSLDNTGAWADFFNNANNHSYFVRFSLDQNSEGVHEVRMRALVTGPYERRAFAVVMDRWHADLDLLRRAPQTDSSVSKSADENIAGVTVH